MAERFAQHLGNVCRIDNEPLEDQVTTGRDEISLLELYDRINVLLMPRVERLIATSRGA